ncbi:IS5 family transposase [Streptomyces sp. NPDC087901]
MRLLWCLGSWVLGRQDLGGSADLVPDDLWERVAPLLPVRPPRRHRYPGRLPADDRAALPGIVYVLRKSVSWRDVPAELVGCSGVTAWRRLRDWTEAGVWPRLHEVLLAELRKEGLPEMDGASIDGSHVRALKGGPHTGPSPVDRARPGSKHHLIVDRHGTPLVVSLTSGNRHDVTQLMPLLDAIPRIRGLRGRPRHRPRRLFADRGYDYDKYRRLVRARGITPKIARRGTPHGSGLGKTRWVVERTFAWLHQFKRLRIRYEIRADLHLGLLQLACSIICLRRLRTSF